MNTLENLFKSREWLQIKTLSIKTDRVLSRTEWLKEVGWQNFSEQKYQEYLQIMMENDEDEAEN